MTGSLLRRIGAGVAFFSGAVFFSYLSSAFFNVVEGLYHGTLQLEECFSLGKFNLSGVAILGLTGVCLLLEVFWMGWKESSLARIFGRWDHSLKTDLFYFFLMCAGITPVLGFFLSLGTGYLINEVIKEHLGLNLLKGVGMPLQFGVIVLVNTFIFYWHHRLFHSRPLWRFHQIHHAAEHFNLITNFRNHPLDLAVRTILYTLPAAVLGLNPAVILAYTAVAGVITCFQHSELDWRMPFIERYVIIGSSGHRLHHGVEREHYNKNFGILVLWDWMFGTHAPPMPEKIPIGVAGDPDLHNTDSPALSLWRVTQRGFRELFLQAARALSGRHSGAR